MDQNTLLLFSCFHVFLLKNSVNSVKKFSDDSFDFAQDRRRPPLH